MSLWRLKTLSTQAKIDEAMTELGYNPHDIVNIGKSSHLMGSFDGTYTILVTDGGKKRVKVSSSTITTKASSSKVSSTLLGFMLVTSAFCERVMHIITHIKDSTVASSKKAARLPDSSELCSISVILSWPETTLEKETGIHNIIVGVQTNEEKEELWT